MQLKLLLALFGICYFLAASSNVAADSIVVPMFFTAESKNVGRSAGTITIIETKYGLLFVPYLHGLKPGVHGFHIYENPSCAEGGQAAGGHFDPQVTHLHLGPYNDNGHQGDLPVLVAIESNEPTDLGTNNTNPKWQCVYGSSHSSSWRR